MGGRQGTTTLLCLTEEKQHQCGLMMVFIKSYICKQIKITMSQNQGGAVRAEVREVKGRMANSISLRENVKRIFYGVFYMGTSHKNWICYCMGVLWQDEFSQEKMLHRSHQC